MPDRIYRIGVIGSTRRGDYGHGLDLCWSEHPSTQIVAVADDDAGGRASAGQRLKVDRLYSDYRKLLDEGKPDIVSVGPRWIDQRRDMLLACVERGVHVYTEKPFCRTLDEADEVLRAASKSGVRVAVAHPTRYSPKLKAMKETIAAGKIGKVLEFRARGKEDQRGGAEDFWVLGTHLLDVIHAVAGNPIWCQGTVTKAGTPVGAEDIYDGAEGVGKLAGDSLHARYGFADGSVADFASHRNAAGKPSRYALQILGTGGVIEILEAPMPSVKCLVGSGWNLGRNEPAWQEISSAGLGRPEPLTDAKYKSRHYVAIVDLLEAIEQKREPLCSGQAARDVLQMIMACFESHRVGGPVKLPLANLRHPFELMHAG